MSAQSPWRVLPQFSRTTVLVAASIIIFPLAVGAAASSIPDDSTKRLEASLLAQPDQVHVMLDLAQALLQRLRVSRDAADSARAHGLIQSALAKAPNDGRVWSLKAWDEMNRHRFIEALSSVHRAHGLGVQTAVSLGLEADALVELGRYEEAVGITQTLVDHFPGLPAFTRVAYLRMLHGDLSGAIGLLRESLVNPPQGSEAHAWAFRQLAELLLEKGSIEDADRAVAQAERLFPAEAQDAAFRARLSEARIQPARALELMQQAIRVSPSPEYVLAAWRLARSLGDGDEARRLEMLLEGLARLDAAGEGLFRRAFAEYALLQGRLSEAERLAKDEFQVRPDIYGHAQLAHVLARSGRLHEASRHGKAALQLGTVDARLRQWAAEPARERRFLPSKCKPAAGAAPMECLADN